MRLPKRAQTRMIQPTVSFCMTATMPSVNAVSGSLGARITNPTIAPAMSDSTGRRVAMATASTTAVGIRLTAPKCSSGDSLPRARDLAPPAAV